MSNEELQITARIDEHVTAISQCREKLFRLYDEGEPFTSQKLIQLGILIDHHGMRLAKLDRQYEDMILAAVP